MAETPPPRDVIMRLRFECLFQCIQVNPSINHLLCLLYGYGWMGNPEGILIRVKMIEQFLASISWKIIVPVIIHLGYHSSNKLQY